jgi:glycosyltransferase involved in cell wall biosynthesis
MVVVPGGPKRTMMRVLHCIPSMEGGGAERQLAYLAAELPALGWDVHVALLRGGVNLERLTQAGPSIHRMRVAGHLDPRLPWRIASLVRSLRVDLVQTWLLQMDVAAGLAASCARVPFVLTERSTAAAYPDGWRVRARRWIARRAAAIVANSEEGCRYWRQVSAAGPSCHVIPNGVPLHEIRATAAADLAAWGISPGERVILYAGRFSAEKNLSLLIEALAALPSTMAWRGVLCGEGPLRDQVASMVRERGLAQRVVLPGYVQPLWAWLKRADVFVSVGLFEGHPNTVLEALACGCRLIVSDIDGHRSFLDTDLASFVAPADAAGLAGAIAAALALEPVSVPARAAGAAALAGRWSVRAVAERYDTLYRRLLGGGRSGHGGAA